MERKYIKILWDNFRDSENNFAPEGVITNAKMCVGNARHVARSEKWLSQREE